MNTATLPAKPLTKKEQAEKERQEAIASLRKMLKPGATVRTILRHRSSSGMFRVISLAVVAKDHKGKPDIFCIDGLACTVLGYDYNTKHDGIPVGGCGMDMGFHLVYNLGRNLFPKGFKVPKGQSGRNGDTSGHDRDGGVRAQSSLAVIPGANPTTRAKAKPCEPFTQRIWRTSGSKSRRQA